MTSFNDESLKKKLSDLNMSQQSIQTMSLWLIHHKKHAHNIVGIWFKELVKVSESKKLNFMYLANDVIQNSKKKGPEYHKEFSHFLPKAYKHLGSVGLGEKSLHGINRLLQVWEERGVFNSETVKIFRKKFGRLPDNTELVKKRSSANDAEFRAKKSRRKSSESRSSYLDEAEFPSALESSSQDIASSPVIDTSSKARSVTPETPTETRPCPEPEQLIKALQNLENAATADAEVRKKIASLPPSVSDVSGFAKLKDESARRNMEAKVDEALEMLQTYNKRLSEEMESRKAVAKLLHDFISHQKDLLSLTEETLEEHRNKFNKVQKIRQELKAHLQNLPDISKLPNVGGSLMPLPSAGDLFT